MKLSFGELFDIVSFMVSKRLGEGVICKSHLDIGAGTGMLRYSRRTNEGVTHNAFYTVSKNELSDVSQLYYVEEDIVKHVNEYFYNTERRLE